MNQKFKTYTGTKTVKAIPMGAGEARNYGAALTDETVKNSIGIAGYLVEYADGYRSWSPAAAFDKAYRLADTYIDRLEAEAAQLREKMTDAHRFYISTEGYDLSVGERKMLQLQLQAMDNYLDVLVERIRLAKENIVEDDIKNCE